MTIDPGSHSHRPRLAMPPVRRVMIIASILVVLMGLGVVWIEKASYDRLVVMQSWPVAAAKVTTVSARYVHISGDEDTEDREYYLPLLGVEFDFNDARFKIEVEDPQTEYNTSTQAVAAHAVGENQKLYVNATNPQESVLYYEPVDPNGWISDALITLGAFAAVAIILLVVGLVIPRKVVQVAGAPPGFHSAAGWPARELAEPLGEGEYTWLKLPKRIEPALTFGQFLKSAAPLAFLSLFWIVPLVVVYFIISSQGLADFPLPVLLFLLVWFGIVGYITFRAGKGFLQSLIGRYKFLRSSSRASARILHRKIKVVEGDNGDTYTHLLQLEFTPSIEAGIPGVMRLEAETSPRLYENLSERSTVNVTYALDDPRVLVLDGEQGLP